MPIQNRFDDAVGIVLDRRRTVRFTAKAFVVCERQLAGKGMKYFLSKFQKSVDLSQKYTRARAAKRKAELEQEMLKDDCLLSTEELVTLLWVGLLHEDSSLTFDDAAELVELAEGSNAIEQEQAITTAIIEAFFLRLAPKSQRDHLRSKLDQIERQKPSNGGTGADSAASLSELELKSAPSGE